MNSKSRFLTFLCIFVTVAVLVWPATAQEPSRQPPAPPTGGPDYVPGEILVKFKPRVSTVGAQNALRAEGLQTLEVSPYSGVMRLRVTPGREAEAIAALLARGDVTFAEPNYILTAFGNPNDPQFPQQWSLNNTGQSGGTPDADIDAPEAWDIYTGSSNIIVAILDSGVDLDHEDLQANIWVNGDEIPSNGVDDDGNGYADDRNGWDFCNSPTLYSTCTSPPDNVPDDEYGHGSHVAGIAAAVGNNGTGIAGVSWRATIMPVKVLDRYGSGTLSSIVSGIDYAVANGADVINMSLGARGSTWPCGWASIEAAFNNAVSHGVLLVAAAGNDGQYGVNCPAAYDQAMAVGSTTSSDTRSSFSNYGSGLDIVAPGSGIYSTIPGVPGGYGSMSGTSMATPHVSGLAALLWSFAPDLTHNQVRDIIQATADDLGPAGWDQDYSYGRINARRALASISLRTSPSQTFFLLDADSGPFPASNAVQVTTASPNVMTWTATISPAVPWLSVVPPVSGTVSAATSPPAEFTLIATRPIAYPYGTYTATAVVTGSTLSGGQVGPVTTEVRLNYLADLYHYIFPMVYKNY